MASRARYWMVGFASERVGCGRIVLAMDEAVPVSPVPACLLARAEKLVRDEMVDDRVSIISLMPMDDIPPPEPLRPRLSPEVEAAIRS